MLPLEEPTTAFRVVGHIQPMAVKLENGLYWHVQRSLSGVIKLAGCRPLIILSLAAATGRFTYVSFW